MDVMKMKAARKHFENSEAVAKNELHVKHRKCTDLTLLHSPSLENEWSDSTTLQRKLNPPETLTQHQFCEKIDMFEEDWTLHHLDPLLSFIPKQEWN